MAANSASECLPKYENENIDPENVEHFRNMFLCMGNEAQKANKLCDWRPGGAVLYCKRPDGPWIFSGVETLAESCNTQDGEEVERPALYTKIDFTSGNSKISFNGYVYGKILEPEVVREFLLNEIRLDYDEQWYSFTNSSLPLWWRRFNPRSKTRKLWSTKDWSHQKLIHRLAQR